MIGGSSVVPLLPLLLLLLLPPIECRDSETAEAAEEEPATTAASAAATTLGTLFRRQARSEQYGYASRYGSDSSSVTSGAIGIRGDPPLEHRDAAYFESRCITCEPNKPSSSSGISDRGWRQRSRLGYYDEELEEERRYRDRYDDYYERRGISGAVGTGYAYERPRTPLATAAAVGSSPYGYDRPRLPTPAVYGYDRARVPPPPPPPPLDRTYDYDRMDPYSRNEFAVRPLLRPLRPLMPYDNRGYDDTYYDRDRNYYDPKYDRSYERGNGYDNLDERYPSYGYGRYYGGDGGTGGNFVPASRRPIDPPYAAAAGDRYYDRYNYYGMRYDRYDDPYERSYWSRPYDSRYPPRGSLAAAGAAPGSRGYYSSGAWGPGYDRGYASAWNYATGTRDDWRNLERDRDHGNGDNWRDLNRERGTGLYRPRDYFYDSTAAPDRTVGSRVTGYLHDRPESSTKPDSGDRDKSATSSPQAQDNKVYQD